MRQLSPRERRYIQYRYGPSRLSQVDAYLEAVKRPDGASPITRESATVAASKLDRRLRSNPPLWHDVLAAAGIDDLSLAEDLNWARNAERTEFYQGKPVATVSDNGTRMRAIELIAELLGHRKSAVEIGGMLGLKGYVGVSPDDWPDKDAAAPPSTPEALDG